MDHHIDEVSLRLCRGKNDVGVVGIWGMGGIGKTTIARAVYDKITYQFEHKGFLYNVKEGFAKKGEAQMRGELLSIILKGDVPSADIFNQGFNAILERLGKKKVLVVLDDVETFSQIEALLGDFYSFGVGSRILVTTRDKESLAGVYETYEARCLNHNESLELFMKHAFRTNEPSEEYSDLSKRAIEYAQGLPLALKVLGYSLYNKSVRQWEDLLGKIEKIPERKILDVLRTSFEGLDDLQKQIFLDIACLFREWDMDFVTELLKSCGFHPDIGLENLVNRALITTSEFGELDMHDLLQEMGRDIVRQESANEPGKRSRLWRCEDVYPVLTENTATDAVECLTLDLSNSKVELCIHPGAFVRMTKLRLLIIYYSFSSIDQTDEICYGYRSSEDLCPKQLMRWDLEFLSHDLRFLLWHGCPLKSLPSTFVPKNLVKLDMSGSHIQQLWEGIKPLQNLKVVNLSHCQDLVKIPDFTEAINLEKLFLYNCSSLVEVHSSVFALQKLEVLNFAGCKLKELPSSISSLTGLRDLDLGCCTELETLPTSIHKSSLERLNLAGCSNLGKFPEILGIMKELSELCLDGTPIKGLPSSINLLLGIKKLSMRNCKSLVFLPDSFNNLADITHLDLQGCTELKTLPTSIHMSSLRTLKLDGCSNLEKFPEISGIMKELSELCLDRTAIKGLPSSINLLLGIEMLSMRNCKSLAFLPDSICNLANLERLDLSGCSALHNLPEKLGDLESLHALDVSDSGIKLLPFSILRLGKLTGDRLSYIGCKEMTAPLSTWPSSMEEYCSYSVLLHLDLSDCNLLELSDGIAHLSSLKSLKLCRNNLESLPVAMNRLVCLTYLELEACKKLKSIPELSNINYIGAHCCTALETVSTQKTAGRSLDFRFSNCFRLLQTNLFRDIVGTHVLHQIFWLVQAYMFRDIVETHLLDQDNHPRLLSCNMCFPGSEIPDWFNHQCRGSSVTAQLPPNWFDHMFLGFAICTVSFFNKADHSDASHRALCYCTFKGNQGDHNFSFHLQDWGFLESDHMFMAYVPWSKFSLARKGELVNKRYYTEATFKVVVQSIGNSKSEHNCMTSCGLRFFHGNYMGMTQPTIHAEGFGAPFFPDQLEIRKSEAEWEAEPSESGEGSGMCQTLEPLSEPGIESEEEEEIMVVAEQGEGRLVLGSVCRCLSLCECNMSLRKREIERDADSVTRVSDNGEISVLGSHSGLVVPNSQSEGKEEREFMGEGSFAGRGLLGPLCSCFYWLGGVWRGNRKVAEAEDFGFPERKND